MSKAHFSLPFPCTNDDGHLLSLLRINLQGSLLGESELPINEAVLIKSQLNGLGP